jgi:quinol monooxygenase YgiN
MKPLTVVASFQARPGQEATLRAALIALIAPTLKEPGCLGYTYHVDPKDPARFLSYETWASQADFDSHMQSPQVQSLVPRVAELCTAFPEIKLWERIS